MKIISIFSEAMMVLTVEVSEYATEALPYDEVD